MKQLLHNCYMIINYYLLLITQLYSKLQLVRAEMGDITDEHVTTRQELEQTLNELTREMKFKYFFPPQLPSTKDAYLKTNSYSNHHAWI